MSASELSVPVVTRPSPSLPLWGPVVPGPPAGWPVSISVAGCGRRAAGRWRGGGGGFFEFFAAFRSGEPAGTRALFILGGLASIAFGVVLFARPDMGAITLALLFGLFNLISGAWMLVHGIELRRTRKTLRSIPEILETEKRNAA